MAEENQVVETNADPHEEVARADGWKPKDEWTGDPNEWRSAKEFVDRKSLFDKIDSLKSTIHELKRDYKNVFDKVSQTERAKYEAEIAQLRAERKQAAKVGDTERVVEISEILEKATPPAPVQQNGPDPVFENWVKENPWYNAKTNLREDADDFGIAYKTKNPNATFQQVLDHVTRKVKELHKDEFATKKPSPAQVESGTGVQKVKTSGLRESDLSEMERDVMNTMIKRKIYGNIPVAEAKQKYMQSLQKAKEK